MAAVKRLGVAELRPSVPPTASVPEASGWKHGGDQLERGDTFATARQGANNQAGQRNPQASRRASGLEGRVRRGECHLDTSSTADPRRRGKQAVRFLSTRRGTLFFPAGSSHPLTHWSSPLGAARSLTYGSAERSRTYVEKRLRSTKNTLAGRSARRLMYQGNQ